MHMRSNQEKQQYRNAFKDLARLDSFACPFAVTLTLKQSIPAPGALYRTHIRLTDQMASQDLTHFLNRLNGKVFGNASRKNGKRVRVIPILEGGGSTRLHYHLTLDCPRPALVESYPLLVRECWSKTTWGFHEIHVHPNCNAGWIEYTSKFQTKVNYDLSYDWLNYHNP